MSQESDAPFFRALTALIAWSILFSFGHLRDFVRKWVLWNRGPGTRKGYAPIRQDYEDFYTRRLYYRIHDCLNRPIASAPGSWIDMVERTPPSGQKLLVPTGKIRRCLNLGSYNYLGFAAADEYCTPRVLQALTDHGWSMCASRAELGTTPKHVELERCVARFLGKEAAITFGMGFATNSAIIPLLVSKGCLIISDALNHASIVAGSRGSGAKVRVFRHNDVEHLEALLRDSISAGQPRTHRPWRKILIIVEGIYSMEGEIVALPEIVALKKKYGAYLFLDEAHSIGALGKTGRGAAEHWGVDTADVDVMMGTFTKSFGAAGGYIASSRAVVDYVRAQGPANLTATAMSPPIAEQIMAALDLIQGKDGSTRGAEKLQCLQDNALYFRQGLQKMGCAVLGTGASPIVPLMLYMPSNMTVFSRQCLKANIAVVVVGFPATPLLGTRVRFCLSASHTRQDLDYALKHIAGIANACLLPVHGSRADSKQALLKS
ncbi:hypothetical protein WJX74_010926 [Apatococcus lobatus]|uniref:serine C-palmitoyltransferase n=2 Tax=Apatococcus TaxID=904362 RepID=A0AAW1T702_9CHLO